MTDVPPKDEFAGVYNNAVQRIFLSHLVHDHDVFNECRSIIKPEYFDDDLQRSVRFILSETQERDKLPSHAMIKAKTGVEIQTLDELKEPMNREWFLKEITQFCKHQAMELIILSGIQTIQRGDYAKIKDGMEEAFSLSLGSSKFRPLSYDDLQARELPRFLIPHLLYEGQIAVLFGEPASYKSFIGLALSSMLAHGMALDGHPMKQRKVLYMCGEGVSMMGLRRRAWLDFHNKSGNDGLFVISTMVNLTDDEDVSLFIREVKAVDDIGLIVFDTLSTAIAGMDENSAEAMTKAFANVQRIGRELNSACMVIHHTGKDGARGARGSSALLGNCDTMWRVTRKDDTATLTVIKQKDAPAITLQFVAYEQSTGRRDELGIERSSMVLVETSPEETTQAERDLKTIAEAIQFDKKYSANGLNVLLNFGSKGNALARIDAAIPCDETRTVLRHDVLVKLTRTKTGQSTNLVMNLVD